MTETLRARDIRTFNDLMCSNAELLSHASKRSGRKPLALVAEHIKLRCSAGRISFPEYVQFGLYDPGMSDRDRRRFITESLHWPITRQCCDMTWLATTEDTWLCARILSGSEIPMPPTLAIIDRAARAYPGTRTIRTSSDLRDFAVVHVRNGDMVFGKENGGIMGFGTFVICEAESDRLCLEREGWFSYEHCLDTLIGDGVYILQPVVRSHEFFKRYTDYLATVRVCVAVARDGPKIPFAVLKLPGFGNVSDHFWKMGNLACEVEPTTGVILRARTKGPLGIVDYTNHPETGARIVGEIVPCWDDVMALARCTAQVFAPVRYQSLDVGITSSGPILIEINTGGAFNLPQLASGRGFLTDEVVEFFAECGVRLRGVG